MFKIHITDLEAAINHWRGLSPSQDGITLAPQLHDLAAAYALLVMQHEDEIDETRLSQSAMAAWQAWYETTPDTPCIAICSTSQGDELCKGCGRTFGEVQFWLEMQPVEKRMVWRRITQESSAWRFNRYADRAIEEAPQAQTRKTSSP